MPPLIPPLGQTFRTLKAVPLTFWSFLLLAFLLINASIVVPGPEIDRFRIILIVYMVFLMFFRKSAESAPGYHLNLNQASIWITGAFIGTVFALTAFRGLTGGLQQTVYAVAAPMYLVVTHLLVVAFAEELIFRGALTQKLTPIPAAVAFGFFHVSAYGGSIEQIGVAIIAGLTFYMIMRFTNIWAAIGVHAGWNLVALGVFMV